MGEMAFSRWDFVSLPGVHKRGWMVGTPLAVSFLLRHCPTFSISVAEGDARGMCDAPQHEIPSVIPAGWSGKDLSVMFSFHHGFHFGA